MPFSNRKSSRRPTLHAIGTGFPGNGENCYYFPFPASLSSSRQACCATPISRHNFRFNSSRVTTGPVIKANLASLQRKSSRLEAKWDTKSHMKMMSFFFILSLFSSVPPPHKIAPLFFILFRVRHCARLSSQRSPRRMSSLCADAIFEPAEESQRSLPRNLWPERRPGQHESFSSP